MSIIPKPKTPKGDWRQVAAGSEHTVALEADGSVACWGRNGDGQCTVPAGLGTVTAVAAGGYHTVALKADGTVACWGYNFSGQCNVPANLGSVQSVAAGGYHTVALKADGSIACWGSNGSGQCSVPAGLGTVQSVAASALHTIALKQDGTVTCWGYIYRLDNIPWNLSDEAWFDLLADYGDQVLVTRIIPYHIRRTEKYRCMRMLMKL